MHGLLLQFQNLDSTSRWMLLGAATLTIVYAVLRPIRRKKDPLARSSSSSVLADQRAVERDMSNLLVELSEMARRITSQLDTRAAKLELLIREAEAKIAELEKASQLVADRKLPSFVMPTNLEPDKSVAPVADAAHLEVYELADAGRSPREIAAQLGRPDGEIELILALRLAR